MAEKRKTTKEARISAKQIDAILTVLNTVKKGDLTSRIEGALDDPSLQGLIDGVNELISEMEDQTNVFHSQSMNLALGLSDTLRVITELRAGHYDSRVDEEMLGSDDELIVSLAKAINEQMDTIQQQQTAIQELSTPVLQIWDDVLALPIIGVVNSNRAMDIMEKLLTEIVSKQSKFVILDITGVEVVDTKTADQFIKIMKSAELLGTQCILTGIRPAVAQTLVELGVELSTIATLTNLKEGLKECFRQMSSKDIKKTTGDLKK